jgi:hypothetical protein
MVATLADIQRKYGEGVYPLYKEQMHEPYMDNGKGGYKGVVLYDESEDKIRCEECGGWFLSLAPHIKIHKMSGEEYKDEHGLFHNVALCSQKISNAHSSSALKHNSFRKNLLKGKKYNKGDTKFLKASKLMNSKAQHKNKFGFCDAQVAARLEVVKEMSSKKRLQSSDIRRHDHNLYLWLRSTYGSISKGCKKFGIKESRHSQEFYEDANLIGLLRKFVIKNKRMPRKNRIMNDFCGGILPTEKVFSRVFGSWRRAKMMAGLDGLLAEVNNET